MKAFCKSLSLFPVQELLYWKPLVQGDGHRSRGNVRLTEGAEGTRANKRAEKGWGLRFQGQTSLKKEKKKALLNIPIRRRHVDEHPVSPGEGSWGRRWVARLNEAKQKRPRIRAGLGAYVFPGDPLFYRLRYFLSWSWSKKSLETLS